MKISVCMAIYNGEKYIEEQLLSLLHQTRCPDEVILCDDRSSDHTAEAVQRFIAQNGLSDSWKFYQNEQNKGYPGNFYYTMDLCAGDVVFLADQDDIWHRSKIEKMTEVLEQHPEVKCVSCKFGLIDEEGHDIHSVIAPTKTEGTGELRKVSISDVFYKCEWPGMVMAYRNDWYRNIWNQNNEDCNICHVDSGHKNPLKEENKRILPEKLTIPHDFLVCAKAAEEGVFLQMDEELAYHRRHGNNAGGEEHRLKKILDRHRKLKEIENYLHILKAFSNEKLLQTTDGKEALCRKLVSMQGRYDALLSGKINAVLKNAWQQRKEVRLATVLCDMVIVKQRQS